MRIQHNIMAMNSYRNYSQNTSALSKNLEKLSSGYKINRAGDDAAGLAISEKMRAQVTGLKAAQKNAKDGISLVQTAEGALTEVHSMLNRMVDLADQSANGTYDNETDRANLQKEVEALKSEIDRIADSTNFNGIKLLDGTMGSSSSASSTIKVGNFIAAAPGLSATENAATNTTFTTDNAVEATTAAVGAGKLTFEVKDAMGVSSTIVVNTSAVANGKTATEVAESLAADLAKNSKFSSQFDVSVDENDKLVFTAKNGASITSVAADTEAAKLTGAAAVDITKADAAAANTTLATGANAIAAGDRISVNGKMYEFVAAGGTATTKGATAVEIGADKDGTMANLKAELEKNGYTVKADATTATTWVFSKMGDSVGGNGSLTLQIGDTADSFNQLTVSVGDMHTSSLGISDLDISTQAGAKAAVDAIKAAINSVSSTRGDLGATQNRLEHTINNLSVMTENIQDAEANIRDVDVAEEMMSYTKNNILVQSAQAMLAQANQIPQGVLQLLQ